MRLTFQIRYHTQIGQSLLVSGGHELLGHDQLDRAVPMHYLNERLWQVTLVLPEENVPDASIAYHYILRNPDGSLVEDWTGGRRVNPARAGVSHLVVIDSWNYAGYYENAFYTEPFQNVLLRGNQTEVPLPLALGQTHTFRVRAPLLPHGHTVCLLGNSPALSDWNTASPVLLNRPAGKEDFEAQLDLSPATFPLAYKYGVYDFDRKVFLRYEEGPNRVLEDIPAPDKHTRVHDGFAVLPATTWKGAGVAIPVFSLRSESSFGIGEFADLKLLADWCEAAGLKLIQILPANDTTATYTWTDSYPYAAISAFALHPLYLRLSLVVGTKGKALLRRLEPERERLNGLPDLDYEAVLKTKLAALKELYELEKEKTFKRKEYKTFFAENESWLMPYAVFCYLRDKHGTADFSKWPSGRVYSAPEATALASKGSPTYDAIAFHYFLQFHLHLQLQEASEYAHARGVILKGDIPIGVYRHGADAWQAPELYRMDMQAGAPPDAFAEKGQNWGFPTYNWPRMRGTGFAWWKQRLAQMSRYFDAFRIDHILGFFRIWSVPLHAVEGILGYFVPALPVHIDEFKSRGIGFERQRYTAPYITDAVLTEIFGAESTSVINRFLLRAPSGNYSLRPEFATQRQVEQYFAHDGRGDSAHARLRQGLFELISNVILFEVEGSHGTLYHFRFAIEKISSFKSLDSQTRGKLWELYLDYFFVRQDDFWKAEALQKLPALKLVTNMLVCGEDLGMVPACVPQVMRDLGLLSLEIQRMPKALGQDFFRPAQAPYLSVVTPSSHDMSTIRGWWQEDRRLIQKFYNQELGQPGEAPVQCEPWICEAIVRQHLGSPAMWSIFQLQELLGLDARLRHPNPDEERINIPANPRNYWRYRMHLPLERLLGDEAFNAALQRLVRQSGR